MFKHAIYTKKHVIYKNNLNILYFGYSDCSLGPMYIFSGNLPHWKLGYSQMIHRFKSEVPELLFENSQYIPHVGNVCGATGTGYSGR
jgi:hypothetical protein